MNQSSKSKINLRLANALVGGWVADSASLGLHWLYDSNRILEVGAESPEFMPPRADYYEGGLGYFAHAGKHTGDVSHYGAATGVLIESLVACRGILNIRDYQRRFRLFFGPGGEWQGYIDNPTRLTLDNLNQIEQEAIEHALSSLKTTLNAEQRRILVQKVLPYTRHLTGDQLAAPVRKAVSLTYKDSKIQEAAIYIAETIDKKLKSESGADDMQLPAISKLPPLVANYYGDKGLFKVVESAVRVTNDNDKAVAWARCAVSLLENIFSNEEVSFALDKAISEAPESKSLERARMTQSLNAVEAGDTFGRTCYLNEAMPVIFHILTHAKSFTEAVRANIQCGGDSCGRAWIIGPVMASLYGIGGERGVPLSWLTRVSNASLKMKDIETLIY